MATKRPRITFASERRTNPVETLYHARINGFGTFTCLENARLLTTEYGKGTEEVHVFTLAVRSYEDFKVQFTAWWESVRPWENIAYDIVIYDRLGRPLGAATEYKPLVARRTMRQLAEQSNGARGIILRRNKRTLEVTQVAGYKRRPRTAARRQTTTR